KDLDILKRLYPTEKSRVIAEKLGRSIAAVRGKAHKLGLKNQNAVVPWSKQEEALLRKLFSDNKTREIASQIGRSALAVAGKAHKLVLRKAEPYRVWSKKELNLLKKLYPSKTAQEIADQIGRPLKAVEQKIFRLRLKKRFRYEESHRVVSGVKQKRCSRCRKWKVESEFHKYSSRKDGLHVWCRECSNEAVRKSHKRRLAAVEQRLESQGGNKENFQPS
ncbi:MAG TPA: hypothetical protein VMY06_02660, partial [Sedimentisphaerales bacterium]|nr:hypothetical protein [Sedimentisphaerales bacterium]